MRNEWQRTEIFTAVSNARLRMEIPATIPSAAATALADLQPLLAKLQKRVLALDNLVRLGGERNAGLRELQQRLATLNMRIAVLMSVLGGLARGGGASA